MAKVISLDRALYNGDNSAERAPRYVDDGRARRNHCSRDGFVHADVHGAERIETQNVVVDKIW